MKKVHWSLWIVGLIAFIWNGLGCLNLLMQINPEMLAQMPDSHRAIAESRPAWITAAFALSVVSGVIGGLLLLLKKKVASTLFLVSLLAAIVATLHAITAGNALTVFSTTEIIMAIVGPFIVGLFFLWYSNSATRKSWIR